MKPTTDGITADVGQSNEDSSRFTRCPYCQAVFRVRPAKLAIRQGEVRCGACREVFNAIRHFVVQADTGRFIPDERAFEGFDTDPIQSGISGAEAKDQARMAPRFTTETQNESKQAEREQAERELAERELA